MRILLEVWAVWIGFVRDSMVAISGIRGVYGFSTGSRMEFLLLGGSSKRLAFIPEKLFDFI